MKSIQDLKLIKVDEDVRNWVRDIYFEYEGEEQYVELSWEQWEGYDIKSMELTPKFRKALDAWHETTDELFESMLDDLSWKHIKRGNEDNTNA